MVSWWPAENNANDIVGANNGTTQGGITYPAGEVGQAFGFNGSDTSVDLGSWFNLQTFTVDMWVNPDASQVSFADIIDNNHTTSRSWVVQNTGAGSQWVLGGAITPVSFNLTPGTWQHLAITRDASNVNRVYVNGTLVGSSSDGGPIPYDGTQFLRLGRWGGGTRNFTGQEDEIEVFDRALTVAEIQSIYNAGNAGKCRTCTTPPNNMVAWWPGDGNPDDIQNGNNGMLQGGTTYAAGKVGQAFNLNASTNSGVIVPSTPLLNPTEAITIDAWIYPTSFPNGAPTVVRKDTNGVGTTQYSLTVGTGVTAGVLSSSIGGASATGGTVPLNQWSHVACTYDRQNIRTYINGVEVASTPDTLAIPTSNESLAIGKENGFTDRNFDGLIDEVEIFGRALTAGEVRRSHLSTPAARANAGRARRLPVTW